MNHMFEAIKTATSPTACTAAVLKCKDETVTKDKAQKLNIWIEYFSKLYRVNGTDDKKYIDLSTNPNTQYQLHPLPGSAEIISIIKSLNQSRHLEIMKFMQNYTTLD